MVWVLLADDVFSVADVLVDIEASQAISNSNDLLFH